jgi:hypothetical protein
MTMSLRYAARSDRGLVRANNEDSVYAGARLLALADGMGGHAAGEVASQLVIAALAHLDDDEPRGDLLAKLEHAVHEGNAAIAEESNTAVGGSFGVAYNLSEWIAVNAEAIGNSRVVTDKFGRLTELRPELTVGIGIVGALNLFHRGERPPGTDPRPGRSIGTRPVSLPGSARAFSGRTPTASTRTRLRPGGMRNGLDGASLNAASKKSLATGTADEPPVSLSPRERG